MCDNSTLLRKSFNMFCFIFKTSQWYEHREIRILMARLLKFFIKLLLYKFLLNTSTNGAIFCHIRQFYDLLIPFRKILRPFWRYGTSFFCHGIQKNVKILKSLFQSMGPRHMEFLQKNRSEDYFLISMPKHVARLTLNH